jgi:hypothetical protein
MDDVDRVLDALKVHIKKEIVDNYFADRVYVEEDTEILHQEVQDYAKSMASLGRRFMALYHALGPKEACAGLMELLKLEPWPFYQEYGNLSGREQLEPLQDIRRRGFTAYRRFRNLICDLYDRLQAESAALNEAYTKIQTHLKLLNEDINKFNLSYDFGLIAAQMEALDGGREESMSGGLLAPEREELSTRMRFKRQKLTDEQLPPPPVLPSLTEIQRKLDSLIEGIYMPGFCCS